MFKFRKKSSEENWKQKAIERNEEIKKLKKRVDELTKSRNKWKDKTAKIKEELYQALKKKYGK